jgi:hypothetical protein
MNHRPLVRSLISTTIAQCTLPLAMFVCWRHTYVCLEKCQCGQTLVLEWSFTALCNFLLFSLFVTHRFSLFARTLLNTQFCVRDEPMTLTRRQLILFDSLSLVGLAGNLCYQVGVTLYFASTSLLLCGGASEHLALLQQWFFSVGVAITALALLFSTLLLYPIFCNEAINAIAEAETLPLACKVSEVK